MKNNTMKNDIFIIIVMIICLLLGSAFLTQPIVSHADNSTSAEIIDPADVTSEQVEQAANEFIEKNITNDMSDLQKMYMAFNYVKSFTYENEVAKKPALDQRMLVTKRGTCWGFTYSLAYLCDKMNIPNGIRNGSLDRCYYKIYQGDEDIGFSAFNVHIMNVIYINGTPFIADPTGNHIARADIYNDFHYGEGKYYDGWVYYVDDDDFAVLVEHLIYNDVNVIIPNTIDGYPVKLANVYNQQWNDSIKTLTIQDGVDFSMRIGGESTLASVSLPSTLTKLPDLAFMGNEKLTDIDLSHIVDFGDSCLHSTGIKELTIRPGQTFGSLAFAGCKDLVLTVLDNDLDISNIAPGVKLIRCYGNSLAAEWCEESGQPYELIEGHKLKDCNFTLDTSDTFSYFRYEQVDGAYSYLNGAPITPEVTVKFNGKTVSSDEYSVEYSDNTETGYAKVKITANGKNFFGTKTLKFRIGLGNLNRTASPAKVTILDDVSNIIYNGKQWKPAIKVEFLGKELTVDTDYYISYGENKNAGNGTVTVTGIGQYAGEFTYKFNIAPKGLDSITVKDFKDTIVVTPDTTFPITQNCRILDGSNVLYNYAFNSQNNKVEPTYENNDKVGTAKMTVNFTGNISGTLTKYFEIKRSMQYATVTCDTSFTYTGSEIKPVPVVKFGSTVLKKDVDYTLSYSGDTVKPGTVKLIINGIGNNTGSYTVLYKILPWELKNAEIIIPTVTYYTDPVEPPVTIILNGKTLTSDEYRVSYSLGLIPYGGTGTANIYPTVDYIVVSVGSSSTYISKSFSEKQWDGSQDTCTHVFGDWTVKTQATCGKEGQKIRYCTICGKSETQVIPATGKHSYTTQIVAPTCKTQGYTLHKCSVCGHSYKSDYVAIDTNAHKFKTVTVAATCETDGSVSKVCTECGYTELIEYYPAGNTEHKFVDKVVAPTCTTDGYTLHTCSVCGTTLKDNIVKAGHKYSTKVIAPTCTKEGYTQHICSVCGHSYNSDSKAALGHNYKLTKTVNSTETTHGYKQYTCSRCSSSYKEELPLIQSEKISLKNAAVSIKYSSYTYSGSGITPDNRNGKDEITVTLNNKTLVKGKDYKVTYRNNIRVGQATAVITGIGSYKDSTTKTFVIKPKVNSITSLTTEKGSIIVRWNKDTSATGYQIVYDKSSTFSSKDYHSTTVTDLRTLTKTLSSYTKPGEKWYVKVRSFVTFDGKTTSTRYGNYSAVRSITVKGTISSASIPYASYTYSGYSIRPTVTVKDSKGNKLSSSCYTVSYLNNVRVGVATIRITGKGNYAGTITKTFVVKPKTVSITSLTSASKSATVWWNKATAGATGYQILYSKNKNFVKDVHSTTVTNLNTLNKKLSSYMKTGETWYVKVRAFVTKDGKTTSTRYGNYSAVRSIRIR